MSGIRGIKVDEFKLKVYSLFNKPHDKRRRCEMRKRQKLILMLYAFAVFFFTFIYAPYVRYYPNGAVQFVGHHLRTKLMMIMQMEPQLWGYTTIDATLMLAQIFSLTGITVALFLLLQKRR
jgi:hypothetical protein